MSTAIALSRSAVAPRPGAICLGLCMLFAVEVLAVTMRFDTESLHGDRRWWAAWLGEAHFVPQVLATMAVAFALFGGAVLRSGWFAFTSHGGGSRIGWLGLAVNFAGLLAFAASTGRLLEDRAAGTPMFLAWLVSGLAVVAGLAAAAAPLAAWMQACRTLGRPFLFAGGLAGVLGFAAGRVAEPLWDSLAGGTMTAARTILQVVFTETTCDPATRILGADGFAVQIAPSCSGYEGLGLVLAFTGLFTVLKRDDLRFPQAIVLIPLGLLAVWSMNVLRITGLIALGASGWRDIARGGFHSQAGWLGFLAVAFGVVSLGRHRAFTKRAVAKIQAANPAVPYLAPLIALVGCAMATAALSDGPFDPLYGLRLLCAGLVLTTASGVRSALGPASRPSWTAIAIGIGVYAAWLGLGPSAPFEGSPIPDALAAMSDAGAVMWLATRILGAVVVVPVVEELAFRGFLLRKLQSSEFETVSPSRWSWPAALASSVCFGLLHPGWWLPGMLAGLLYAFAFSRRGRLLDAVAAHATTNALLATHVLITGHWWLW